MINRNTEKGNLWLRGGQRVEDVVERWDVAVESQKKKKATGPITQGQGGTFWRKKLGQITRGAPVASHAASIYQLREKLGVDAQ